MNTLESALHYASLGWRVVPLHHITKNGGCSCNKGTDCRSAGKHPIAADWPQIATTDTEQITRWLTENPNANIGIATGQASNLLVLDIDPDNGGEASINALFAEYGALPATYEVGTGGDGVHYYLTYPSRPRKDGKPWGQQRGRLGAGLDIRAEGGMVVAPPSASAKGTYQLLTGAVPAEPPEWLLDLIDAPKERPAPPPVLPRPRPTPGSRDRITAYVDAALKRAREEIVAAPWGEFNSTLNAVAYSIGRIVGADPVALPYDQALSELVAANNSVAKPDPNGERTIRSGLDSGMREPATPWPPVDRSRPELSTVHREKPEASQQREASPSTAVLTVGAPETGAAVQVEVSTATPPRDPGLWGKLLNRRQLADLPALKPLIADTIDLGTVALLAGGWGTCKSFTALDWSACVATGRSWQGRATEVRRVLYLAAEGAYGLDARLRAWEQGWQQSIGDEQFVTLPAPVNLSQPEQVRQLVHLVAAEGFGLVVFDTLAKCAVGCDENSARDMGKLVDALYRVRDATNGGTVLAVHHAGKAGTVRGSSALEAGVDTAYVTEGDSHNLVLRRHKRKDGPLRDEHALTLSGVPGTGSAILVARSAPPGDASAAKLLDAFRDAFSVDGATKQELQSVSGMEPAEFYGALNDLLQTGDLINVSTNSRAYYRLGDA